MTTETLVNHAVKFGFGRKYEDPRRPELFRYEYFIESRGLNKWAVTDDYDCYDSKEKCFVYEPSPSSRTDAFLENTRFSLDKAVEIVQEHSRFCYDYCIFLSITEALQNTLSDKPDHICKKYNVRVKHEAFHPKLMRCEGCLKEEI